MWGKQRMKYKHTPTNKRNTWAVSNENGFLLVITLSILVILSLIGLAAIRSSQVELKIAGNDRVHKETFYEADGGTEAGGYLLEENINCPNGFSGSAPLVIGSSVITSDLKFWANETDPADLTPPVVYPSDTTRHIKYANNATITSANIDNSAHTNMYFHSNSSLSTGNAIQMIAGYEGTGYSAAQGGGQLVTVIASQHLGVGNSRSTVRINWRHIIGLEGTCKY